jgi:hypothetical protein
MISGTDRPMGMKKKKSTFPLPIKRSVMHGPSLTAYKRLSNRCFNFLPLVVLPLKDLGIVCGGPQLGSSNGVATWRRVHDGRTSPLGTIGPKDNFGVA